MISIIFYIYFAIMDIFSIFAIVKSVKEINASENDSIKKFYIGVIIISSIALLMSIGLTLLIIFK